MRDDIIKIGHELATARTEAERDDVAICRVEQLYPLPTAQMWDVLQQCLFGAHSGHYPRKHGAMGRRWLGFGEQPL